MGSFRWPGSPKDCIIVPLYSHNKEFSENIAYLMNVSPFQNQVKGDKIEWIYWRQYFEISTSPGVTFNGSRYFAYGIG